MSYKEIDRCRVGGSENLVPVLNLGNQALTGVFPKKIGEPITCGPLELVFCPDSGLLQLRHSYDVGEMYGDNYGYRSGLNQSMVEHLTKKVHQLEKFTGLSSADAVLDIGSNDATTLNAYSTQGIKRVGIDPTGHKFAQYYSSDIKLVSDFFSAKAFKNACDKKAKIVTSIAMFYDLENPIQFAQEIESILTDDGIWHFEQSYMPSMLRLNSYDTICHEHLEYYSLSVVDKILKASGLKVIDVGMNSINGGSFAISAAKADNKTYKPNWPLINWLLEKEDRMGLNTLRPFHEFAQRVDRHREDLTALIRSLVADGKKVLGYGASTKGNVLLQYCGFTPKDIVAIAEVNEEKFGRVTPGTNIPIISEKQAHAMEPDYFLVLPWHFKEGILRREKDFIAKGGKFIFPFPEIEIL